MIKRKLFILLLAFSVIWPCLTLAQGPIMDDLPDNRDEIGWADVATVAWNVVDFALQLVAGIAIIFIIIGGYQYIMAFGNPEAIAHAKNTVVWAIVGLILAVSSVMIVRFINERIAPSPLDIRAPNTTTSGGSSGGDEENGNPSDGDSQDPSEDQNEQDGSSGVEEENGNGE